MHDDEVGAVVGGVGERRVDAVDADPLLFAVRSLPVVEFAVAASPVVGEHDHCQQEVLVGSADMSGVPVQDPPADDIHQAGGRLAVPVPAELAERLLLILPGHVVQEGDEELIDQIVEASIKGHESASLQSGGQPNGSIITRFS